MNEPSLEFEPNNRSLFVLDDRFLYTFTKGTDETIIPLRGITKVEVKTGFGRMIEIKQRFGPTIATGYDKQRQTEVESFADQIRGAARAHGAAL